MKILAVLAKPIDVFRTRTLIFASWLFNRPATWVVSFGIWALTAWWFIIAVVPFASKASLLNREFYRALPHWVVISWLSFVTLTGIVTGILTRHPKVRLGYYGLSAFCWGVVWWASIMDDFWNTTTGSYGVMLFFAVYLVSTVANDDPTAAEVGQFIDRPEGKQ